VAKFVMQDGGGLVIVLGVDPGREKCGIAVVSSGGILAKEVISRNAFRDVVKAKVEEYNVDMVIMGDGTGSKEFHLELKDALPNLPISLVDEFATSEEARSRYWIDHKPKGWRRLLPTTMQVPPEPYDDYVAVILAERFLCKS